MKSIGGHDRALLANVLNEFHAFEPQILAYNGPRSDEPYWRAAADIVDPAKLAAITAEALRAFGVNVRRVYPESAFKWLNPGFGLLLMDGLDSINPQFSCADGRAALLRILTLPEGATPADAMKALEVGT